jgi:hypothetical protein
MSLAPERAIHVASQHRDCGQRAFACTAAGQDELIIKDAWQWVCILD